MANIIHIPTRLIWHHKKQIDMRRRSEKIDIDNLIVIGSEFISDEKPKTIAGKILRWLKKLVKIKTAIGIKIK